jgi:hypothetical protein
MKVSLDTKLYAVVNTDTGVLVPRYTGGFFWTRKGDAEAKLHQVMRRGSFELITCSIGVIESQSGDEIVRLENEALAAKKAKEAEKRAAEALRAIEVNKLREQLKELTGFTDVPTVKTFLVNTVLVPDYRVKIENVITELQKLKA